jgi:hypothetical protein
MPRSRLGLAEAASVRSPELWKNYPSVCRQDAVPKGVNCERDWRCLRVAGTIPFSAGGILASLTASLAEVGISLFAVSTFDTDYLLVKEKDFEAALNALRRQGHVVENNSPTR